MRGWQRTMQKSDGDSLLKSFPAYSADTLYFLYVMEKGTHSIFPFVSQINLAISLSERH